MAPLDGVAVAAQSQVASLTLANDVRDALAANNGGHVLTWLQRWSQCDLLPLDLPDVEDVSAAVVKSKKVRAELILVDLRKVPIKVSWRGQEFDFTDVRDACTGDSIVVNARCGSLHIPSAAAVVASIDHLFNSKSV
jgi:hypothetical protein